MAAAELKGVRLDHVAVAVPAIAPVLVVARRFGARPNRGWDGAGGSAFGAVQAAFWNGARLEAIMPAGAPGGFLHRFLARDAAAVSNGGDGAPISSPSDNNNSDNSPTETALATRWRVLSTPDTGACAHHVTFYVRDLAEACAAAEARGWKPVGVSRANPQWFEAFLHPKDTGLGLVVQLAETSPAPLDQARAWETREDHFATAADDLAAHRRSGDGDAKLLGVCLSYSDAGAARCRAVFGGLLGATVEDGEDGEGGNPLIFRWASSPLYIRCVRGLADGVVGLDTCQIGRTGFLPELGVAFIHPGDEAGQQPTATPFADASTATAPSTTDAPAAKL